MSSNSGILTALVLTLGAGTARAQVDRNVESTTTHTPVNVGLVPYVDVNSHVESPRNNVSIDGVAGLTTAVDGAAIAGVAGIVREDLNGVQLGGVAALTLGRVEGAQVGGVFSYANELRGAQIGLVNIAGKVTGAQVGLINIAEEVDGVPLGLLNIVLKDGTHTLDLYTTDTAAVNIGTRLGSKYFYSVLTVGFQPTKDETTWMPGVGLGGHIPIRDRWSMDVAALAYLVNGDEPWNAGRPNYFRLQTTANYRLDDSFTAFAGPSLNIWNRDPESQGIEDVSYLPSVRSADGDDGIEIGIGFVAGIQVF